VNSSLATSSPGRSAAQVNVDMNDESHQNAATAKDKNGRFTAAQHVQLQELDMLMGKQ